MEAPFSIPSEIFWAWLIRHPNCILRAATQDAVLYDDEDLHWQLGEEKEGELIVQLNRGKRILGELFLERERVAYVQAVPGESEEEHVFEWIAETESGRFAAYVFVMAHGFEEEETAARRPVH